MSEDQEKSKESKEEQSFREWITSPQMLVSLSAVLLSVCGLFVSIYETSIMREKQYASVWPHVELGPSIDGQALKILIRNTGVGPAQIKAASIIYNNDVIANWEALTTKLTDRNNYRTGKINLIGGNVLPPSSDQKYIFRLDAESETEKNLFRKMRKEIFEGNFDVNICYCSVYDECWTTSMQNFLKRYRGEKAINKKSLRVQSCKDMPTSGI